MLQDIQRPTRVLLVDDHEIVRRGMAALLARRPSFQVVAEAGSAAEAIGAARAFRPEMVIMDARLPDGSGVDAARAIRAARPETRVVILTGYPDDDAVFASILAGVSAFLLKHIGAGELVQALEAVARGDSLLDSAITGPVLERVRGIAAEGRDPGLVRLTAQERRILPFLAEGQTNEEIAGRLFLAEKTVNNYVSSILGKLNLRRRSQAAAFVSQHHLYGM